MDTEIVEDNKPFSFSTTIDVKPSFELSFLRQRIDRDPDA